jgi:hypothetical protein
VGNVRRIRGRPKRPDRGDRARECSQGHDSSRDSLQPAPHLLRTGRSPRLRRLARTPTTGVPVSSLAHPNILRPKRSSLAVPGHGRHRAPDDRPVKRPARPRLHPHGYVYGPTFRQKYKWIAD